MDTLTPQQILDADLADWRQLGKQLHSRFKTGSFVAGLQFVTAITAAAEAANHHPDVTLTYPSVALQLVSHDAGALTQRDVDLARVISEIARGQGIESDPGALSLFELALDTADHARLGPFWAAVLADSTRAYQGDEVVDGTGQSPNLWFQGTDEHPTPRQRFHVDLWVGHDVAADRIAAGVAAGGVVVDDSSPEFTVLADPDGNKVCICTIVGR